MFDSKFCGGREAVVLGMSRSMKRSVGWLDFSWRRNEGSKECMLKSFLQTAKTHLLPNLAIKKLFL